MKAWRALALLTGLTAGCGASPQTATVNPAPAADTAALDGHTRLSQKVRPERYQLELTVDPTKDQLFGQVSIALDIAESTQRLQLHGRDLIIESARVTGAGPANAGRATMVQHGGLVIDLDRPVVGKVTLELRFKAKDGLAKIPAGLYQIKEAGKTYGVTQFEAMDARRAFPCFDQPEFKTPYSVRLRVPKGELALANSLELSRTDDGEWTTFEFAETKPLPTYLVAFAVGPWVVVDGPKDAIPGTPLRLVTVPGKEGLTAFAMDRAIKVHAALSDYFGRAHPFDKLDLVGVPNFAAGAMENVGLVTFREVLLLLDPERAPVRNKMFATEVLAHELAHMWFGNLVTPLWWDDLWLNEAFATWMEAKAVDAVLPDYEEPVQIAVGAQRVMRLDAKKDARAIRQPIKHGGDVRNAFDGITYSKGAAVLQMLEAWIGPEAFREGTRAYMTAHEYGSGTTAALMKALGEASKADVNAVALTFIDQPGTPLVTVKPSCEGGKATLSLSQRRYLPMGSTAPQGAQWKVPICVRYGAAEVKHRQCMVLDGPTGEMALEGGCPAWIHPNSDQLGYYRWSLPEAELLKLVRVSRLRLSKSERAVLPYQITALFEAGEIKVGVFMKAMADLAAQETQWLAVTGIINGIWVAKRIANADEQLLERLAIWTRATLKANTARLGLAHKDGEPVGDGVVRPTLVRALAGIGRDPKVLQMAHDTVEAYLADPGSVSLDALGMTLSIVARRGDAALWQMLRGRVITAKNPVERSALVRSLGAFHDLKLLVRSLNLLLDGTLRAQDLGMLRSIDTEAGHRAAFEWMAGNYDRLLEVLGKSSAGRLPGIGRGLCTAEDAAKLKAFFEQPGKDAPGTARNLALTLEGIDECARIRAATVTDLKAALSDRN